jgi:hypothetical protein
LHLKSLAGHRVTTSQLPQSTMRRVEVGMHLPSLTQRLAIAALACTASITWVFLVLALVAAVE